MKEESSFFTSLEGRLPVSLRAFRLSVISCGNETEASLLRKAELLTFYSQFENVNSPYRSTYVSFKVGSENWVVHQNKIPQLMTLSILVTSLLVNI